MEYLNAGHLDSAFASVRPVFAAPQSHGGVDECWPSIRNSLNFPALEFCTRSYLASELDTKTQGERGLGRVSLQPPRLGGHFRDELTILQTSELWELYYSMLGVVLSAYVGYALLMEKPPLKSVVTNPQTLFEKWVPLIYMSSGRPPRNVVDSVMDITTSSVESLLSLLQHRGIDAMGQPANLMVFHYVLAGVYLRGVEVGYAG